jgi:hypothetical protein
MSERAGCEESAHLKGAKVAVVDAEHVGLHARDLEHSRQLSLSVHLDERHHAESGCGLGEVGQVRIGQHRRDEKHGVRTGDARLYTRVMLVALLLARLLACGMACMVACDVRWLPSESAGGSLVNQHVDPE